MYAEILNPRRAPRAPIRCLVEVRDRFAAWSAETEDLGPKGCQLVTPRLAARGRELHLQIRCDAIGRVVRASGRVVWSRAQAPSRVGVEFEARRTEPGWFETLLAAEPAAAVVARRTPDRLARTAPLHLGEPPRFVDDFSAEEVAVLRRVADGTTVDGLAQQLGPVFERVRGAVFGLLARRLLVPSRAEGVPASRWSSILASAERSLAAAGIAVPAPLSSGGPGRTAEAQALFDEGMAHLTAGRIEVAVARLREATALAPHDSLIKGALLRLAPWSSEPAPVRAGGVARRGVA